MPTHGSASQPHGSAGLIQSVTCRECMRGSVRFGGPKELIHLRQTMPLRPRQQVQAAPASSNEGALGGEGRPRILELPRNTSRARTTATEASPRALLIPAPSALTRAVYQWESQHRSACGGFHIRSVRRQLDESLAWVSATTAQEDQ